MKRTCSVEGCENPTHARGWCSMHYKRWRTNGDPLALQRRPKGTGTTNKINYRLITVDGQQVLEHRKVMERKLGRPLLPEEVVHHKGARDDNRPEMLEVFPNQATHIKHHHSLRTECANGHALNEENTYEYKGIRYCRMCRREYGLAYRAARRRAAMPS